MVVGCGDNDEVASPQCPCAVADGQCIFRHDTFGDEQLWTETLKLHELVQTLTPKMALAVGLKVDADAVPAEVLATADLDRRAEATRGLGDRHVPDEARRSVSGMYRTTPLRGAWQHPPYFHDGSAATLANVVEHYDQALVLGLSASERADLEQYLRSL